MDSNRLCVPRAFTLLLLGTILATSGCAMDSAGTKRNSQIDWRAPSATIRVEVEVYKGPLSKEPAVQIAELKGIFTDSDRAMDILIGNMDYSHRQMKCYMPDACMSEKSALKGCEKEPQSNCAKQKNALTMCEKVLTIKDTVTISKSNGKKHCFHFSFTYKENDKTSRDETQACNSLRQLFHDIAWIKNEYESAKTALNDPDTLVKVCGFGIKQHSGSSLSTVQACMDQLRQVSTYGSILKRRAAYWAAEHVATSPTSKRLRIEMANFAQFAAEYGNQITSRADALLKQAAGAQGDAILREQLPNSTYLRDSEPTAYLNLYDWNKAAVESGRETTPAERVRMVEQLVTDNYWSHINTVFAAGQGDVSMALVKDDVGNWNLKSFDNNPGKILAAYKNLGLAAVKATVDLASRGGGLSASKNALNFADQVALGSTSGGRAAETQERLTILRQETARLIRDVGKEQKQREQELTEDISRLTQELGQDAAPESGLRGDFKIAATALKTQHEVTEGLEMEVAKRGEKIEKHQQEITSLTEQRDNAKSELNLLLDDEDAGTSGVSPEAAPLDSTASEVAVLKDRVVELDKQISSVTKLLSVELRQQALELNQLKIEREKLSDFGQVLDQARTKRDAAEASYQAAQIRKSDLLSTTTARLQQLLDLHSAVVAQMAIAVAETAGASALEIGIESSPDQTNPISDSAPIQGN